MNRQELVARLDRLGIALMLAVALLLRSNLSYRTIFLDEAINLFGGWQMLHGQDPHLIHIHMGWPALSLLPLGLAGWLGGIEAVRALNALLGVLTVLVVMLIARRVYGRAAGFIAGGIYASYGSAIFISTFATYDALSVLLASLAVYLWLVALAENRRRLYALGSLTMALAVLTKYAAVMVAAVSVTWVAISVLQQHNTLRRSTQRGLPALDQRALVQLVPIVLPLLILPAYLVLLRGPLSELWQSQVLTKQSPESGVFLEMAVSFAYHLGPLLLLGVPALMQQGKRGSNLGLLAIGLSLIPYQLLNRDINTLGKHCNYMVTALAPLAAGGVMVLAGRLERRATEERRALVTGGMALVVVAFMALSGRPMLSGYRGYWTDTTELMRYLRSAVSEGEVILMEQGQVGRYYLIEKGQRGHVPREVVDTWWYEDEQGRGTAAYRRAVVDKRFDWIVIDYMVTPELDHELLPLMAGRYELAASFPARLWGLYGQIDVFRAIR
jgi:4-amino-4-deoxy-L-arabinose transferase-like glycosyltransferase